MIQRLSAPLSLAATLLVFAACSANVSQNGQAAPPPDRTDSGALRVGQSDTPVAVFRSVDGVTFGEPRAVTIDFAGNPLIADGVPGRVVRLMPSRMEVVEYDTPSRSPGFYPSDLTLNGFFTYVIDEVGRTLLRFDRNGAYLDVLIRFDDPIEGRRVSPFGLDVDGAGRIAISDVESHRIVVFDSYLTVELVFGTYGSFPGQFHTPEGISFTRDGGFLVTDSGNSRIQQFDDRASFIRSIPAPGDANPLTRPRRAVMDKHGNVFIADPSAGRVFVFDREGTQTRSIVPDGAGSFEPTDIAVTESGLVYVTDEGTQSLYVFR